MKQNRSLRFSIVIPCYNEAEYIEKTLESLQAQNTTAQYEVIVVDNNCIDETVAIAKRYQARIVHEQQPGVCAARQAGCRQARGEIIISTDADTKFKKNWLAQIDQTFKDNPQIVAVGGPCRYYDGPWWGRIYTHFLFGFSYLYFLIRGYPSYITATNFAFKKSYFEGYDLNLIQGGDELGLLRQLRKKGKILFNPRNYTLTSGRRLKKGIFYNIFITFFYYYLAAYYVNSLFHKQIIGSAPAVRRQQAIRRVPSLAFGICILLIIGLPTYINMHKLTSFITENTKDIKSLLIRDF